MPRIHLPAAYRNSPAQPGWNRRHFLKAAVGTSFAIGLFGCDVTEEDPFEIYDGPEITEADFVSFNAGYYDIGIDGKTQFPHTAVLNGAPSGTTDPIAIAYRMQRLIDLDDAVTLETIVDHLLLAQEDGASFIKYRGLLPALDFNASSTGFEKTSADFEIQANACLSARVAMTAQAYTGTPLGTKAMQFLQNQTEGYNYYFVQNELLFSTAGNAITSELNTGRVDLLFEEFYAEMAFVLSYFVGHSVLLDDPTIGIEAWNVLIDPAGVPTDSTKDSFTELITFATPLAKNGSAYQYFHPLLTLPLNALSTTMQNGLYNVLYAYLDAARFGNLPGIYSGGPDLDGAFEEENGLSILASGKRFEGSRQLVVTVDALAAALRLFPAESQDRQTVRRWMGVYDGVAGVRDTAGLFGSIGRNGDVVPAMYARQNGAMILFETTGPAHLEAFLEAEGRTTLAEMFASVEITHEGLPIEKVNAPLPLPPMQTQLFTSI
ncbi:MAG: hypothetical protein R2834_11410 [Rhodothermales bacterium]